MCAVHENKLALTHNIHTYIFNIYSCSIFTRHEELFGLKIDK